MKRTSLWKRGIGLLLVSALLAAAAAALAGCGTDIIPSGTAQLGNLTEGLTPNKVTVNVDMDEQSVLITDFALRLLRASRREGESTLVSPLSVLYALAMTANGAEGETKGQIESALGLRIEELNEYLYGYNVMLPQGLEFQNRHCQLHMAERSEADVGQSGFFAGKRRLSACRRLSCAV